MLCVFVFVYWLRGGGGAISLHLTQLTFNPLNTKLNPICHLLALLEAHHILHVSRVRVKHCNGFSRKLIDYGLFVIIECLTFVHYDWLMSIFQLDTLNPSLLQHKCEIPN
jgi:hypothetical protein